MDKKLRLYTVLLFVIAIILVVYLLLYKENSPEIADNVGDIVVTDDIEDVDDSVIEQIPEFNRNIKIDIGTNTYDIELVDTYTVRNFYNVLPIEGMFKQQFGNELYHYIGKGLPTDSEVPNIVNSGDIYLYGDKCIVIFYKTFSTTQDYTYIGHINGNIEDIAVGESVSVKLYK